MNATKRTFDLSTIPADASFAIVRPLIVLSLGMGVDSVAILLRWLLDPTSRSFDLRDLIVITAMTGDEFASTGTLMQDYLLPLMRKHGVRYIQVARKGHSTRDGIAVLSDSRETTEMHIDGVYKLSQEFLNNGTHQPVGGCRKCSQKQKGHVLDSMLSVELHDMTMSELNKAHKAGGLAVRPYIHVIGFSADELRRVKKDQDYGKLPGRVAAYPLVDWKWGRDECLDYIEQSVGVRWEKSACGQCPFAQMSEDVQRRFRDEPELAAMSCEIEMNSLVFNHRMHLYGEDESKSVFKMLRDDSNIGALRRFEQRVEAREWAIWKVRRVWKKKNVKNDDGDVIGTDETKAGNAARATSIIARGSRDDMEKLLATKGTIERGTAHNLGRVWSRTKRTDGLFPAVEECLVVGPVIAREKEQKSFQAVWDEAVAAQPEAASQAANGR
jgi:hypothetical protein